MTAPTESEVRAALSLDVVTAAIDAVLSEGVFEAYADLRELWNDDDFRASERTAWEDQFEPIYRHAAEYLAPWLIEQFTAAGLRFAAEYPDAPRARERVPA